MRKMLCFLHYPPRYRGYECPEILAASGAIRRQPLLLRPSARATATALAVEGLRDGVDFRLVAADYTGFRPVQGHSVCAIIQNFFHKSVDISVVFLIEYIGCTIIK